MDEIGSLLKATRESSGITIDEVSADLNIKDVMIENVESGKIGAFQDIYQLKSYLISYAKYLGLDSKKIINNFNEYMFEYTSKIPVKEIEKAVMEKTQELKLENKVISPYTKEGKKHHKSYYIFIYIVTFMLIMLVIIWSIKQITINKKVATIISCSN